MKNQAKADLRRMSIDALVKQTGLLKLEIRKMQSLERNKREKNVRAEKLLREKLAISETFIHENKLKIS